MSLESSVWPPELDAVIASPQHHVVLFENDEVRVLETKILMGEITELHTHEWAGPSYIIDWTDCVRRDENGEITYDSRHPGSTPLIGSSNWSPPLGPHTLKNVGEGTVHVIRIELKPKL